MRWALPDRVFFACGACHILAHAFLERYGTASHKALWFKPASGFIGSQIVLAGEGWILDYRGYAARQLYLAHTFKRTAQRWSDWTATMHDLPSHEQGQVLHPALRFEAKRAGCRTEIPRDDLFA